MLSSGSPMIGMYDVIERDSHTVEHHAFSMLHRCGDDAGIADLALRPAGSHCSIVVSKKQCCFRHSQAGASDGFVYVVRGNGPENADRRTALDGGIRGKPRGGVA